jgi:hypothetical protein
MQRPSRDPQVDLIRRYARILRSAPAEALRAQTPPAPSRVGPLVRSPSRFARADDTRSTPAR